MLVDHDSSAILHPDNLKIVLILTAGFTFATFFGYCAQKIKLSPILGFLLAGYVIGPFFPGFTADIKLSEQLAEIGVILMMFGVGLHFKWQDLVKVKSIAITGAIGQTSIATLASILLLHFLGNPWQVGLIVGLSIGVASTVVLVRVLTDLKLVSSKEGHIAVGWLIAEDILTVVALVLLPTVASLLNEQTLSPLHIAYDVGLMIVKFCLLALFMFTLGAKIVTKILVLITRTQSAELFTLAILSLTFLIATGSALLFGASIALGAFIAGMVIGQTDVRHQASMHASAMKDAFLVIFFLSVGMLFNPMAIVENLPLFFSVLFVILVIKPLTAFLITIFFHYPVRTATILAIALAQIGEFSFILSAEALKLKILPDEAFDIIVACSLVSISINPLLFKWIVQLWGQKQKKNMPFSIKQRAPNYLMNKKIAVLIGFDSVAQSILETIIAVDIHPVIIDGDIDVVGKLKTENYEAIFGNPSSRQLLKIAKIKDAQYLILNNLEIADALLSIKAARKIQPHILIFAHANSRKDAEQLNTIGVDFIFCDEEELSQAFSRELFKYWKIGHRWKVMPDAKDLGLMLDIKP